MNSGINLLPGKRRSQVLDPRQRRLKLLRLGGIVILFLVGIFSGIISVLIIYSPLEQVKKDEQKARGDLAVFRIEMNKLAFVNDRGDSIRELLAKRPNYDKKIEIIESKMPEEVDMDGLSIVKNRYTFRFSSRNLNSIDDFINKVIDITGKGGEFSRVYLTGLSVDTGNEKFVLVLDLITI